MKYTLEYSLWCRVFIKSKRRGWISRAGTRSNCVRRGSWYVSCSNNCVWPSVTVCRRGERNFIAFNHVPYACVGRPMKTLANSRGLETRPAIIEPVKSRESISSAHSENTQIYLYVHKYIHLYIHIYKYIE